MNDKFIAGAVAATLLLATAQARASHGHTCQETSDVVGDRRCGRFGDGWSRERTIAGFIGVGAFTGIVQPGGKPFNGSVEKNGATVYTLDGARFVDGPLRSYGAYIRLGGFLNKHTYLGWEFAFAGGHARTASMEANGYTITPSSGVNFMQGRLGPLIGMRMPLGKVSLRLEGLVGIQALWLGHEARGTDGVSKKGSAGNIALLLEPRVAADWWVTPDTTLSLWGGMNALRPGDYTGGIAVTAHGSAFDGAFR